MPTLEEITAWSDDQAESELRATIPETASVEVVWDAVEGYWRLTLRDLDENGALVVKSEETHMDRRLLILNAYGQYWLTKSTPSKDSPWVRRHGELSREFVTQRVHLAEPAIPDPDDLDPTEVHDFHHKQET